MIKPFLYCLIPFLLGDIWHVQGQSKQLFKIHTVAFYNLENAFDTIDDPLKFDESSPIMAIKSHRGDVFDKKIKNMARAIADIGRDRTHNAPVAVGVAEIENRDVLEALLNDASLKDTSYGIIHYDSPDARGIDVALLYQKQHFIPTSTSKHVLKIYDGMGNRIYTRDQLLVGGFLDGELLYFLVNHWPSRRGGDPASARNRVAAAKLTKHLLDSLQFENPYAKVVIMGDFNDNPTDIGFKMILKAESNLGNVKLQGLFNPFETFYKQGQGTTAYRDEWSLFDQIMVTKPLLEKDYTGFQFYKAGIFNKAYLITKRGQYKGYPLRSWGNGGFTGGFSDHFPVYIYLIKAISRD